MQAEIIGENDSGIGVDIVDNNKSLHEISIEKESWDIVYHESDSYPDNPSDRTKRDNEHVNQARRFARYWVYRKRGYDTLNGWQNPDRITLAAIALKTLSSTAAEEYLGDLHQQLVSLSTDADPAVDVPDGVDPSSAVYKQDVYLGLDEQDAATYATVLRELDTQALGDDAEEGRPTISESDLETLADETAIDPDTLTTQADGLFIEATSGVHLHWDDPPGQYRTQWGDQPAVDRDPDGRLALLAFEPDSITELTRQAVRNLLCQVRDCYLTMGIAPPERFRLLGHGRHDASTWYVHNDFYENYHDPEAEISTWYEDHTPANAYNTTTAAENTAQPTK